MTKELLKKFIEENYDEIQMNLGGLPINAASLLAFGDCETQLDTSLTGEFNYNDGDYYYNVEYWSKKLKTWIILEIVSRNSIKAYNNKQEMLDSINDICNYLQNWEKRRQEIENKVEK